jgi:hypothetical protein
MSESQLERAYQLIKEGREQDALDIIEPILSDDPNNADAWWLLANATEDLPSKQHALEEVLRIGTTPEREAKAREMLNATREMQNSMADPSPEFAGMPRQSKGQGAPRRKILRDGDRVKASSGGGNAGKTILMIVGGLSVFACMLCIGVVALIAPVTTEVVTSIEEAGGFENMDGAVEELVMGFREAPDDYIDMEEIEDGDTVTGAITSPDDRIGYTYEADAGDRIRVEIRALTGNIAPPVFVYSPDGLLFEDTEGGIESENSFSGDSTSTLTTTLQRDGDYLLIIRPVFSLGQNEYEMTLTVLNN